MTDSIFNFHSVTQIQFIQTEQHWVSHQTSQSWDYCRPIDTQYVLYLYINGTWVLQFSLRNPWIISHSYISQKCSTHSRSYFGIECDVSTFSKQAVCDLISFSHFTTFPRMPFDNWQGRSCRRDMCTGMEYGYNCLLLLQLLVEH